MTVTLNFARALFPEDPTTRRQSPSQLSSLRIVRDRKDRGCTPTSSRREDADRQLGAATAASTSASPVYSAARRTRASCALRGGNQRRYFNAVHAEWPNSQCRAVYHAAAAGLGVRGWIDEFGF